jgi:uncharacterized protein YigE (DUF2233 family)
MSRVLIVCLMLVYCSTACALNATPWEHLAPGFQYRKITVKKGFFPSTLHAFKINLKKYRLSLVMAKDHHRQALSAQNFANKHQALLAINGGFFSPDFTPLGLRINNGELRNPMKRTSWWGVFYVRNARPYIVKQRAFRKLSNISFAIQGGPRLIANGRVLKLKPGAAERSAVGITRDHQIVIVATNNSRMTTTELARIMATPNARGGLSCVNALNLDGGSSTQLYAKVGDFQLSIPSIAQVSDAIVVEARQ